MLRREILSLGAASLILPRFAFAQSQKVWRVGVLTLTAPPASLEAERYSGFIRGMRELGYVEGKNLSITWRFADNSAERMAAMAAELVQSKVDLILTLGVPPTAAAKRATASIPIVMGTSTDPLSSGLVTSLSHPGGNITGLSNAASDLSLKHLELMTDVVPKLTRIGVLSNPATSTHATMVRDIGARAQGTKVSVVTADAETPQQIDSAVAQLASAGAGAVIVLLSPLFNDYRGRIAELALKHRLPSVSSVWQYADSGGLLNYGPNLASHFHRAATFVDKIFKGTKPGDLPIEQPTTYEMIINRKTAQALRLMLPQALLLRADRVIG